jgi:hypothetical protein
VPALAVFRDTLPHGKELFYLSPDQKLMAVPLEGGSPLNGGTPQALFDVRVVPNGSAEPWAYYQYDVAADGQRFLISTLPEVRPYPSPSFSTGRRD